MKSFLPVDYSSKNIIRINKSRMMRKTGHACDRSEIYTKFWSENLSRRIFLEDTKQMEE
jgi:hypothetical protein